MVFIGAAFFPTNALAVFDQTRAANAGDDFIVQDL